LENQINKTENSSTNISTFFHILKGMMWTGSQNIAKYKSTIYLKPLQTKKNHNMGPCKAKQNQIQATDDTPEKIEGKIRTVRIGNKFFYKTLESKIQLK